MLKQLKSSKSYMMTLTQKLLSVLILALLLAACGNTATTAPTVKSSSGTATPSGSVITVQLWTMPNTGQSVQDLQTALADFYKQNPNIRVEATEVSWGDAFGKIQAALATGIGPDITQVGTTWVGAFATTGALRPFTDSEIQAMGGITAFSPAAWDTTHLANSSSTVAIPWFVDTRALAYRTDVLKKAGLDPSTAFKDWNSFVTSLQKMKATEGDLVKAPIGISYKNDYNVIHNTIPWIWGAGGNILNADDTKSIINNDAGFNGIKFYTDLYTQGLAYQPAIEKDYTSLEESFRSGEIGSYISDPYVIAWAKHTKAQDSNGFADTVVGQNFGTAVLPAGPSGSHPFVGGSDLVILKSSKQADAAVKVVQYLASKQGQLAYQKLAGALPANVEAQSDSFYSDPLYKPFMEALKVGYSYPEVPSWGAIEQDLQKSLSNLWDDVVAGKGDIAIKTDLDETAQEINSAIANSK